MRRRRPGTDGQGSALDHKVEARAVGRPRGAAGRRAHGAAAQFRSRKVTETFRRWVFAEGKHGVQRSAQVVTRKVFHPRGRRQPRNTANREAYEPTRRPENDEQRMEERRSCGEVDAADEQGEQRDRHDQPDDEVKIGAALRSHGGALHESGKVRRRPSLRPRVSRERSGATRGRSRCRRGRSRRGTRGRPRAGRRGRVLRRCGGSGSTCARDDRR